MKYIQAVHQALFYIIGVILITLSKDLFEECSSEIEPGGRDSVCVCHSHPDTFIQALLHTKKMRTPAALLSHYLYSIILVDRSFLVPR